MRNNNNEDIVKEYPFSGLSLTFETLKKKVLALPPADIPAFRDKALYLFVADLLRWFYECPSLDLVRIKHELKVAARGGDFDVTVVTDHSITVYAPAAGFDRDEDSTVHDSYVAAALPFTVWGTGFFEIHRTDPDIQRALALHENAAQEWEGLVAEIALRMDRCFGQVRQIHAIDR